MRTIVGIAAEVGFIFGVVAGTSLGWLLLRRVPIWRAVGETALAAGCAALLALLLDAGLFGLLALPASASLLAAFRLRWSHASRFGEPRIAADDSPALPRTEAG
jgi:hypothetical protein